MTSMKPGRREVRHLILVRDRHHAAQYCCLPNFVRSDRSQEGVDQLRLSERYKIPVNEPAHMLTCSNQRLFESCLATCLPPLSSLGHHSRAFKHTCPFDVHPRTPERQPTLQLSGVAAYLQVVRGFELDTKLALGRSGRALKQHVGPTGGRPENCPMAPANARKPDRSKHCGSVIRKKGPACAVLSSRCITLLHMCAIQRRTLDLFMCARCSQLFRCSHPACLFP